MGEEAIIWCGPDKPPKELRSAQPIHLNSYPNDPNVHLKIENISRRLARELPPLVLDLLEIASYVYSADQSVGRGGRTLRGDGARWRRQFGFRIPVRRPEVWGSEENRQALIDVLSFLSDDYYEFKFRPQTKEVPFETYFDFDAGQPWFDATEVQLFSGGLDSLAGLCEAVTNREGKIILVSHRPAPQTSKLQKNLLVAFANSTGSHLVGHRPQEHILSLRESLPDDTKQLIDSGPHLLHVPVWVYKSTRLTKDADQRTRSFLYMALAAALAALHGLNKVYFYENGITSSNLPIAAQVKGARASRTTHPKVLKGFSKFLSMIFGKEFMVENPFFWKTKADIVKSIKDHGLPHLIRHATSCSHVRIAAPINIHCGVCAQCIGRRLATLYHSLEDYDPEKMYKVKHPSDPITRPDNRAMVELVIKIAREFERMSPDEFFAQYGEASRLVTMVDLPAAEAAERLYDLHKRHGEQVCEVLGRFIKTNSTLIAKGKVQPDSLLSMIEGLPHRRKSEEDVAQHFPTPDGTRWEDIIIEIISDELARIRVGTQVKTYTNYQMGFQDRRKRDRHNILWTLLLGFAKSGGRFTWESKGAGRTLYKNIHRLRNLLKEFFGLGSSPIFSYLKGMGYVTRFKIVDRRFGKR